MNTECRQRIRLALSDAFVDQPLDAVAIARQLVGYDPALLEEIFFCEVAPLCSGNLQTPVPPVWTAFDAQWLQDSIEQRLLARRRSRLRRWMDALMVRWLRWQYADLWREIADQLR